MMPNDEWLSLAQASERYHLSRGTILMRIRRGSIDAADVQKFAHMWWIRATVADALWGDGKKKYLEKRR